MELSYSLSHCFDWFQCSFDSIPYSFGMKNNCFPSDHKLLDEFLHLLELKDKFDKYLINIRPGYYGHKFRIDIMDGVFILLCGPESISNNNNITTFIILGKGCTYLREHHLWVNLLKFFKKNKKSYGRLDSAIDLKGISKIDMWYLYNHLNQGYYTSSNQLRTFQIDGKPPINEEEANTCALTLYVGSRKSENFLRIYNKAVEQDLDSKEVRWIRFESEIKDNSRIECIVDSFLALSNTDENELFKEIVTGILIDQLTISSFDNKRKIDDTWEKFINNLCALKTKATPKSKTTFESSMMWFETSVSKFVAEFILVYGEESFLEFAKKVAYHKMIEFDNVALSIVNLELERLGCEANSLTLEDIKNIALEKMQKK